MDDRIPPSPQPASPDLIRAVVQAFLRQKRAGAWEYYAWQAARRTVTERCNDLAPAQAGELATRIIAYAANQPDWPWKAVG